MQHYTLLKQTIKCFSVAAVSISLPVPVNHHYKAIAECFHYNCVNDPGYYIYFISLLRHFVLHSHFVPSINKASTFWPIGESFVQKCVIYRI